MTLTDILTDTAETRLREQLATLLSQAGAFCGDCGFQPGDRGCPACESCWTSYATVLLPLLRTQYAAGITHAVEEADRAGGLYAGRGDHDRAGAAFALMEKLQGMAAAARRTPCSVPECDVDGTGEPCSRHEREDAHADGNHELCGPECFALPRAATVHFDHATLRLVRWTATVFGADFVVTGTLVSGSLPTVGDDVPITRLDLPGRGRLEGITARVSINSVGADIVLTIGFPALEGTSA
jgi:hypothetical protein